LDDLRRRLRRYRKIHVICDNAGSHTSLEVIQYLWKHEDRLEVHLLPAYSPDLNPIERVWWHLHENITRNHRSYVPHISPLISENFHRPSFLACADAMPAATRSFHAFLH
jgi:transposase